MKLATDTKSFKATIAADKTSAKALLAADNRVIAVEKAQLRINRKDPPALAVDKAAYAAAKLKLHQDTVATKAQLRLDTAKGNALVKADKAAITAAQRQLRKDQKAAKAKH